MTKRGVGGSRILTGAFLGLAFGSSLFADDYRYKKIDVPHSISTEARGINARGDIVGSYSDADDVSHGFLLDKGTFTTIDVPGAAATNGARAINARGDIVGNYVDGDELTRGFLLRDGEFLQIAYPGATQTSLTGINNAGDITGSHFDAEGNEKGFILRDGVFHNISIPGTDGTAAFFAQDNGRVWVGQALLSDETARGWVRHGPGDFELLLVPGAECTVARWINQRGDIVGISAEVCGENLKGWLLRDGQFERIEFPRSTVTRALAINDDGVIVGSFTDRHGVTHGFQAIPEGSNDD